MDLHSVRKQPCRMLLLALTGTSLLLLYISQAGMTTFLHGLQQPNPRLSSPYPSRRIQDYQVGSDDVTTQRSSSNDQNGVDDAGEQDPVDEGDLLWAAHEHRTAQSLQATSTPMDTEEETVQNILKKEREVLREAMQGYSFHPALKAKRLEDLVPESGGEPVRSLVITTWRSGSTFIGDVLQSHPATYYHYEPLLDFDIKQVRHGDAAKQALHNLRHLLTCDYSEMEHYLKYGQNHPWLFSHNMRLWAYCNAFPQICWKPKFLTPFCKLFPFQSLKTVRLRLNLTTELLQDKKLGVQVLLLVRDPRGTMQSRRHRVWCPDNPDCDDPAWLCRDLVSDFRTAKKFLKVFPHSFRLFKNPAQPATMGDGTQNSRQRCQTHTRCHCHPAPYSSPTPHHISFPDHHKRVSTILNPTHVYCEQTMIRYEDLSFNAYNATRELFEFFHLSYHPRVKKFLDTHTRQTIGGVSSTFRDSKVAPVHWRQDLSWEDVNKIQSVCGEALRLWGYKIAKDEAHLRSFNPVGEFKTIL